jgi:hypothetical protein
VRGKTQRNVKRRDHYFASTRRWRTGSPG